MLCECKNNLVDLLVVILLLIDFLINCLISVVNFMFIIKLFMIIKMF